jgi:nucleotide-binding universal stress UspA family protein
MLKRILLLLADTASSMTARDYALRLAQQTGAEVAGLAGIDLSDFDVRMPGAIGAATFRAKLEEELKAQAAEIRQKLRDAFERQCRERQVTFEWVASEGEPVEMLQLATESRDLLISGHDTAFQGGLNEPLSDLLSRLTQMSPRPAIICPDSLSGSDEVLIAYDGSFPAMRAVQMFALLGLGAGREIQVLSIDDQEELAVRRADGAATYLRGHGLSVSTAPVATRSHPGDVIRSEVTERNVGTLVMGAYGRRGIREMLFGSTTNRLVADPPCAVFLYH